MILSRFLPKYAAGLLAAAALAFGFGYAQSQLRGFVSDIDQRGYNRAIAELTLQHERAQAKLRNELEGQARRRELEIESRRLVSEAAAREANERADKALRELINNDASFAQCERQILPDAVIRHWPRGVLHGS